MQDIIQQFLSRDAGPIVQFIKYGIGGGIATVVDVLIFYTIAWKIIPALREDDPVVKRFGIKVKPVTEKQRSFRFIVITCITFIFSNLTAYLLSIFWIFEPGKHVWYVELLMFYAVSGISLFIGTFIGWLLIKWLHLSTTSSYFSKMMASLLINFVCRKFIIFKG